MASSDFGLVQIFRLLRQPVDSISYCSQGGRHKYSTRHQLLFSRKGIADFLGTGVLHSRNPEHYGYLLAVAVNPRCS